MEVYILDSLLRRDEVVDTFESLIWTERYAEWGDFELSIPSTRQARLQFVEGKHITVNTSHRVMTVETVEDELDDEGRKMLRVKGCSIEKTLGDRLAKFSMANLTDDPEWVITGLPAEVARTMFAHICVDGALNIEDKIPFIFTSNYPTMSNLPEPETVIRHVIKPQNLYDALKELCDIYDLGFRLVRDVTLSRLYFNIYAGSDRTTRQNTLEPVILAIDYDNLQNSKELRSIANAKNVAYVFSDFGTATVYADNVPEDVTGFERRVLFVEAQDIDEETPPGDIQGILIQQGKDALSQHKTFSAFEGELNKAVTYVYGTHYNLGDIIEMRNEDGIISYKRVTEQIFVHDQEGERAYPTLSIDKFLAANTWLSQLSTREWIDFGATEYWSTM